MRAGSRVDGSTIFSLSPFSVTVTLSRGATATTENMAPSGFQHLVQPQAWLWAMWPLTFTLTGSVVQAQTSVPPAKLGAFRLEAAVDDRV